MVKTLENLEVGDVVKSDTGQKSTVLFVNDAYVLLSPHTAGVNGNYCYPYQVNYMVVNKWTVEQPLGPAEKAAKALLEKIGFKVTR